ncbi:MAG TPA: hypothetical protein VMC09_17045, partial [Anaerolineales bacterium]|nr:hypothetical protein [Anaerolineales bacterium]
TVSDPLGRHPDRVIDFDGRDLPTSFLWDRNMGDLNEAPIGIYTVTVAAWDDFGHTGRASGLVIVPAPGEPVAAATVPGFGLPPTRTPSPTPTGTDTPAPTATATLRPSPTPTATKALSAILVPNPAQAPNPDETPIPAPTDNVVWGATAAAAIAAVTAYILDEQRKRKEELDEENAQVAAQAAYLQALADRQKAMEEAQAKAEHEYQAALYAQYVANQEYLKQQRDNQSAYYAFVRNAIAEQETTGTPLVPPEEISPEALSAFAHSTQAAAWIAQPENAENLQAQYAAQLLAQEEARLAQEKAAAALKIAENADMTEAERLAAYQATPGYQEYQNNMQE